MRLRTCISIALATLLWAATARAGFLGPGATSQTSAGETSQALTAPTFPTNQNCVMVAVIQKSNANAVSSSGWNNFQQCGTGGIQTDELWKAASGAEGGSYTFSWTGSNTVQFSQIEGFCGVNKAAPIDVKGCSTATSTNITTASVTPSVANEPGFMTFEKMSATFSTFPTGPIQGPESANGSDLVSAHTISNASAQQYTMTAASSTYYTSIFFMKPVTTDHAWGFRSLSIGLGGSRTTATIVAPVNIQNGDSIHGIILTGPNKTPSCTPGTWTFPNHWDDGTSRFWEMNGTGLLAADGNYTCTWDGSSIFEFHWVVDDINITGTDAFSGVHTASGSTSSCFGPANTTTHANEPLLDFCSQGGSNYQGGMPNGIVAPIYPPGPGIPATAAYQTNNAMAFQPVSAATTVAQRTYTCSANCGTGAENGMAMSFTVGTPAPSGKAALYMSIP